jgi:hypothetical protein
MRKSRASLYKPPSGWEVEINRFKELVNRWLDFQLNKVFDLSIHGPDYRRYWTLALGAGFVAGAFFVHAFLYFSPIFATGQQFQLSVLPAFFIETIVRLVIILFIPTFIAITLAGNYLADIFELKDTTIAWDFIKELSLGGANEILHIRDGKISEDSLNSPILLIGGPGRILVEFDSAALFETPDGTPNVIGLANANPDPRTDNFTLEGFERLREPIINLRDQYIGNLSSEPMTVFSRSLDGIPVSATDVRGVFSVHREQAEYSPIPSIETPYPFNPRDIENIIYKQSVPVLTEGPYSSGLPPQWTNSMQGLIYGSLSEFMSQNNLAEYLTSIGALELELSEFREDTILSNTLQFSSEVPDSSDQDNTKPKFHPRSELSDRFTKYTEGFSKRARERGLELHWIGVGTWKMPDEITNELINDQHLEAWRINRENADRSTFKSLESVAEEAYFNEKARLILNTPLSAHQKNQTKYSDKDVLIECLLQDYWEQFGDALQIYYKNDDYSEDLETIEKAVIKLERFLNITQGQHMIGGSSMSKVRTKSGTIDQETPPAPATRSEAEQYRKLLSKLEGNYKVAEGMIANEAGRHPELIREELIIKIVNRFERYGR